jgi:hypothetical protein
LAEELLPPASQPLSQQIFQKNIALQNFLSPIRIQPIKQKSLSHSRIMEPHFAAAGLTPECYEFFSPFAAETPISFEIRIPAI